MSFEDFAAAAAASLICKERLFAAKLACSIESVWLMTRDVMLIRAA
jgi:hypothetical protein